MKQTVTTDKESTDSRLSSRIERLRIEVEKVVEEVGEHPLFELKTMCTFSDLWHRIEFVKDIQAIATSRIETEKFMVIGADAANKSFSPVVNLNEFDESILRQLLKKHLEPVPEFEVFQLNSSKGVPFVLVVIPKQKTRRILAKSSVVDPDDKTPRLLLREGDLWTKGASTSKRVATPDDWDEIYRETVERETEEQTKKRTAHFFEQVTAQERLRANFGIASLPSVLTDRELSVLMEDICLTKNEAKFRLLLERIRDDAIEGWHSISAFERSSELQLSSGDSLPRKIEVVKEHKKIVFLPAMKRLTLIGLLTIKNKGPFQFVGSLIDLLKEVFETSHDLKMLKVTVPAGQKSKSADDHISHTLPAIEAAIALHLIGSYMAKRERFEYFQTFFRAFVIRTGRDIAEYEEQPRIPMAFWPIGTGWGESEELSTWQGRIKICTEKAVTDGTFLQLFGSRSVIQNCLMKYEFCLELNSFLAVDKNNASTTTDYVGSRYPNVNFGFSPSFIAFELDPIWNLSILLLDEIRSQKPALLNQVLFDGELVKVLARPDGEQIFLRFLKSVLKDYSELHRFSFWMEMPAKLKSALESVKLL